MTKPWDNEPTPITNCFAVEEYSPQLKLYADINVSRNLERRMRAAERLLQEHKDLRREYTLGDFKAWSRKRDAHLESARKEDRQ